MRTFSYICEVFVTAVLLFLVPVFYFSLQQELLLQGYVRYQVVYFTDSIRNTGYISANRYEEFKQKLELTSHVYDIELSVYERYQNSGTSEEYYQGTYTEDILKKLYKDNQWYKMHQGNFVTVTVRKKDASMVERLLRNFGIRNIASINIPIQYGGMVRDECF